MTYARRLSLPILAALCLTACATAPRLSTEQRNERPTLPTAPPSLLGGERSPPPLDSSGAAYVEAYGAAKLALERANRKLTGWATLWACSAQALAAGEAASGCSGQNGGR